MRGIELEKDVFVRTYSDNYSFIHLKDVNIRRNQCDFLTYALSALFEIELVSDFISEALLPRRLSQGLEKFPSPFCF